MAESPLGICLLGCGVVGGGVLKILTEQAELLRSGLKPDTTYNCATPVTAVRLKPDVQLRQSRRSG